MVHFKAAALVHCCLAVLVYFQHGGDTSGRYGIPALCLVLCILINRTIMKFGRSLRPTRRPLKCYAIFLCDIPCSGLHRQTLNQDSFAFCGWNGGFGFGQVAHGVDSEFAVDIPLTCFRPARFSDFCHRAVGERQFDRGVAARGQDMAKRAPDAGVPAIF